MIIETFKIEYKGSIVFSCNMQVIDGFGIDYEEPIFNEHRFFLWFRIKHINEDYHTIKNAVDKNGNSPNSNFFLSDLNWTDRRYDFMYCKFYINNELIEFNFEDKKLIDLTLKNIADKYINVIYSSNVLFVFGTSPSKQMLDKHLNIRKIYKEYSPNEVIGATTAEHLENLLKKRNLDIKNVTVKISGLCNYGVIFGLRTYESFFYFILEYKSIYVFEPYSSIKNNILVEL